MRGPVLQARQKDEVEVAFEEIGSDTKNTKALDTKVARRPFARP